MIPLDLAGLRRGLARIEISQSQGGCNEVVNAKTGFGVRGSEFGVRSLEFGVRSLEFGVRSLGFFFLLSPVSCLLSPELCLSRCRRTGRPPGNRPGMASIPGDEAHSSCSNGRSVCFSTRNEADRLIGLPFRFDKKKRIQMSPSPKQASRRTTRHELDS